MQLSCWTGEFPYGSSASAPSFWQGGQQPGGVGVAGTQVGVQAAKTALPDRGEGSGELVVDPVYLCLSSRGRAPSCDRTAASLITDGSFVEGKNVVSGCAEIEVADLTESEPAAYGQAPFCCVLCGCRGAPDQVAPARTQGRRQ